MQFTSVDAGANRLHGLGWRCSSRFGFPGHGNYTEFWRKGRFVVSITQQERDGPASLRFHRNGKW